jgi:lipoprotein-releasing system permease protein
LRIPLDLSIALRYLLKRQGGGFLTVIATISVLGIAVGVMALFIALGLMTGLQGEIRERILGATAHISVFKSRGEAFLDPTGVAARVAALPGVAGAAPSFYGGSGFIALLSVSRHDQGHQRGGGQSPVCRNR